MLVDLGGSDLCAVQILKSHPISIRGEANKKRRQVGQACFSGSLHGSCCSSCFGATKA